ncbi:MAG: LamG-like jellyroll fold domain-containing protein [Verrucomicrobiota bacterium]
MKIEFPSREFDDAVAAVCHDSASEAQVRALNELLRRDMAARDEYLLRLELHARLASDPDLFVSAQSDAPVLSGTSRMLPIENVFSPTQQRRGPSARITLVMALAACLALLAAGFWSLRPLRRADPHPSTSKAVAMLNRTADAQWNPSDAIPRLSAPLEPGRLRLEAGLAQVIFYSGARVVLEGPAELQLVSQNEAVCRRGRIVAEIPAHAHGFRIKTPHMATTELGMSVGLDVTEQRTALHMFKGNVKLTGGAKASEQAFKEGSGALIEGERVIPIAANRSAFASLFDLQARSVAAEARRHHQWRIACKRLAKDASLLLHFDFENVPPAGWQIRNLGNPRASVSDATIVGCQWTEGRWPEKRALEFQSVNDRVRFTVPGEFQSLTLSAWICVKGLDRKINSLFMSDGFEAGTVHWLIRRDGVLGLTVIGPGSGNHQIIASPPVVTLEKFGMWLHLAVVLDAGANRVVHYFNGIPVSEKKLKIAPPFRIGAAELGNWNAKGFPENDPFMIRNFSGAMDEFFFFSRALGDAEVRALYVQGKPQPETVAALKKAEAENFQPLPQNQNPP